MFGLKNDQPDKPRKPEGFLPGVHTEEEAAQLAEQQKLKEKTPTRLAQGTGEMPRQESPDAEEELTDDDLAKLKVEDEEKN